MIKIFPHIILAEERKDSFSISIRKKTKMLLKCRIFENVIDVRLIFIHVKWLRNAWEIEINTHGRTLFQIDLILKMNRALHEWMILRAFNLIPYSMSYSLASSTSIFFFFFDLCLCYCIWALCVSPLLALISIEKSKDFKIPSILSLLEIIFIFFDFIFQHNARL